MKRENELTRHRKREPGFSLLIDMYKTEESEEDLYFLDVEKALCAAGRDYTKKYLSLLCSDFADIFKQTKKMSSRDENLFLLEMVKDKLLNLWDLLDIEEMVQQKADEIYDDCLRLENELKALSLCSCEDMVLKKQKEETLLKACSRDAVEEVEKAVYDLAFSVEEAVSTVDAIYSDLSTANLKKKESRHREESFVRLVYCLGLIFDSSVFDMVALRACLLDTKFNQDYELTTDGFFSCLEDFEMLKGCFYPYTVDWRNGREVYKEDYVLHNYLKDYLKAL